MFVNSFERHLNKIVQVLFSSHGRINRTTYWIYSILIAVLFIVIENYEYEIYEVFEYFWILYLLILYPTIMIQVKRWHDRNKSGYWILINLIPVVGIWALIENGFLQGDNVENNYGLPQT